MSAAGTEQRRLAAIMFTEMDTLSVLDLKFEISDLK